MTAKQMQNESEMKLREQIREMISVIKDDSRAIQQVRTTLGNTMKDKQMQSAREGYDGAKKCRDRLRERRRIEKANIELFKTQLAQSDMPSSQVNAISDLITLKNTDIPNGYFIKSKLSPKQKTRVNDICRDLLN